MSLKGFGYPTIRPSLDLRFAQTKRLDPRVTFQRTSVSTYVDAQGVLQTAAANVPRFDHDPVTGESLGLLVEESRTNYRSYSSIPAVEYTSDQNKVTIVDAHHLAPDGTASAISVANNTGVNDQYCWSYFTDYASIPTTGYICASIFVKMISGNEIEVKGDRNNQGWIGFAGVRVNFSTPTPTVTLLGASGQNAVDGGVYPYPDEWWRVWFVVNTADGFATGATRAPAVVPKIAGTSAYIWGAQIEAGTFPTSYIPTPATFTSRASTATYYDANGVIQTAGENVARDDAYFPDENGAMQPAGLLLEGAGTNLVTYSEDFSGWQNLDTTTLTDQVSAPDGTTTAELIYPSSTGTYRAVRKSHTLSAGSYVTSIFAKSNGISFLTIGDLGSSQYRAWFDLQNGSIGNVASGYSATIQKLPNGWCRCSLSHPAELTGWFYVGLADSNGSTTATASGTSGIYIWGAQLEASPYPTSYIPTDGTAGGIDRAADVSTSPSGGVERVADVAQITGSNFSSWYNQSEGSFVIQHRHDGVDTDAYLFEIGGTSGNYATAHAAHFIQSTSASSYQSRSYFSGSGSPSSLFYFTKSTPTKVLYGYKSGDYITGADSVLSTTSQSSWNLLVPTVDNYLGFGRRRDATRSFQQLHLSRLTYYPVRLDDSTLQTITK